MEVLAFQIVIFIIIMIAGFINNSTRNFAVALAVLFTIVMVFTNALMIIQFITILISFIISRSINNTKNSNKAVESYKRNSNTSSYSSSVSYANSDTYASSAISSQSHKKVKEFLRRDAEKKKPSNEKSNKLSDDEKKALFQNAMERVRAGIEAESRGLIHRSVDPLYEIPKSEKELERENKIIDDIIAENKKNK